MGAQMSRHAGGGGIYRLLEAATVKQRVGGAALACLVVGSLVVILQQRRNKKAGGQLRYIVNESADFDGTSSVEVPKEELRQHIFGCLKEIKENYNLAVPQHDFSNITLYGGKLGIAYMFLELYDMWPKEEAVERKQFLEDCHAFLQAANRDIEDSPASKLASDCILSLMVSHHGLNFVSCLFWDRKGDAEKRDYYLNQYLSNACNEEQMRGCSSAVNMGSSSYLQGLYFLRNKLGEDAVPLEKIETMMNIIVNIGTDIPERVRKQNNNAPLVYKNLNGLNQIKAILTAALVDTPVVKYLATPLAFIAHLAVRNTVFNGMAIGLAGEVYALMNAPTILHQHPEWERLVKDSCDHLLGMDGSCNAPFGSKTDLMDWCLGTPGVVQLMARAAMYFEEPKYIEAAKRGSDIVWEKGLMKKGNGLCHGVSGNAFVFLDMYRATNEEKYLHRAVQFAKFSWSLRAQAEQRTPDHKYSLFEGMAGAVLLYAGLYTNPRAAMFPLISPQPI